MNTLLHYLKDAAALEAQLYTQNQIISSLTQKINSLGYANKYEKPQWHPWRPELLDIIGLPFFLIIGGFIPGTAIVWFIIGLLELFFDLSIIKATASLFETIGIAFKLYIKIAIILSIVGTIWEIYSEISGRKREYSESMQQYNESVKKDKIRVKQELALKTQLRNQLQTVISERNATQSALSSIYDVGIIHSKYRHLVALASFFDYFDTGRCISFTGPGGAYATYEEDLRFQRLETKLDVIISKLDELISSQRMLAELMQESNDTLYRIEQSNKSMMRNMSQIRENTDVIQYNTHCAMQSSAVMEHIMVYNTLKEN